MGELTGGPSGALNEWQEDGKCEMSDLMGVAERISARQTWTEIAVAACVASDK